MATKTKAPKKVANYELNACQKIDQIVAEHGQAFVILHLTSVMLWNSRFAPLSAQAEIAKACEHLKQAYGILERIKESE